MKKILGISLCALFAVSAANAEIASTAWVTEQIGGIATNTADITTLKGRVDGHDTAIEGLQGVTTGLGTAAYTPTTDYATAAQGDKADSALQQADVATGGANGTIRVKNADVAVKGLGTAAYRDAGTFATTAQGTKADSALQQADVITGTTPGAISVKGTPVAVHGLGTAAYKSIDDFATGEEGELAASAVQAADVATGGANGTISVKGADVAVKGLGTAAYKSIDDFATGEEGDLAASALQPTDVTTGGRKGTISVDGREVAVAGLGSAAYTSADAYAPSTLTGTVNTNTSNISALTTRVNENEANIEGLQEVVTGHGTSITALQESVTGLGDLAHEDTVTTNFITDGTIMNADISDTAKIAMNKIDFSSVQTGAIDSGIDSAKVAQIETNKGNINTNKNSITAIQDFLTDMVEEAPGYTDCKSDGNGCTLVLDMNGFKWEKVTREAQ